jgi:CHAT domain-containing protein
VLMAHFYEELKAGQSPPAALAHAQLRLRREPRFHEPRFWAAFFIEGEYR